MIYLATSLFTLAERDFGFALTDKIEQIGYKVYYPWRDAGDEELIERFNGETSKVNSEIVRRNLKAVRDCNQLIAVTEGADVDSGTSMEIGFAHALGKRIRCLRTDFRTQGERIGPVNIMISEPAEKMYASVDELIRDLEKEHSLEPHQVRDLAAFYDAISEEYSNPDLHPTTALFKDCEEAHTTSITSGQSYGTVLDIGCGDGNFLCNVTADRKIGVDSSIEMIRRHKLKLPDAKYILTDCTNMPVGSATVDVIHSSFLLDHLNAEERKKLYQEATRIMKQEGLFLLAVYTPAAMTQVRAGKTSFEYVTAQGKRYEVPSDFAALANLKVELEQQFNIDTFATVQTGTEGLSIDYYILKRK